MKKIISDSLKFTLYHEVLDNGLNVIVVEKPNFQKVSGYFTTNFGSIDNKFELNNEIYDTPLGIAHFLEHIVFHTDDESDASIEFEKLSAEVNAFTSKTETTYYFNTLENVDECINLLLDFVQTPYCSRKIVESERKIIEQEINMINDNVDEQLNSGLLNLLFKDSPIKNEIGGTVDTIKEITPELLNLCYETFYHPSNMHLIIIGGVDHKHIFKLIKKNQQNKTFKEISKPKVIYPEEIEQAFINKKVEEKQVSIPKINVGLKLNLEENNIDDLDRLKRNLGINFLFNYFYQYQGVFYNELDKLNLMNDSFQYAVNTRKVGPYIDFNIDINEVELFEEKFINSLLSINNTKIDKNKFNILKKKYYASIIKGLNEYYLLKEMSEVYLKTGIKPLKYIKLIKDVKIKDLNDSKRYIKKENISVNTFLMKN